MCEGKPSCCPLFLRARLSAGKKSSLVRVCRPGRNRELDKRINDWFAHEIVSHRRWSLSWDLTAARRDQLAAKEKEEERASTRGIGVPLCPR